MTTLGLTWLLLRKDLQIATRSRDVLGFMVLFALLCAVVFAFGFLRAGQAASDQLPGVLWVTLLFSGTVGLLRLFSAEEDGGTLLLDEIGDVPLPMQAKLLRVLQEREVRRVGENRPRAVDVRVIAATHRDLARAVADGQFRQDLYYRLCVIGIRIPALRERRDDILPLARRALAELAPRMGVQVTGVTPAAADLLLRWSWPGNVRELQNAIERALVLATGSRIDVEDLPLDLRGSATPAPTRDSRSLDDVERAHILHVLASVDGHRAKAAAILGIGTATLFRKLRAYGAR